MVDIYSKKKRSELMSRVRNKDTDIELLLRKALWSNGYRYRLHYNVPGSPDIVFISKKVAIFCDGDFWHGRNFKEKKESWKKFWRDKIRINMKRDKRVNRKLEELGWTVLRFWKTEIKRNVNKCITVIEKKLNEI